VTSTEAVAEAGRETEAHRPVDSGGINAVVPLAALAAHPENPRTDLGDLTELAASIAAQGLFEPLVVVTVAAYAREGGQRGYRARRSRTSSSWVTAGRRPPRWPDGTTSR
jgi:hypothetical protein